MKVNDPPRSTRRTLSTWQDRCVQKKCTESNGVRPAKEAALNPVRETGKKQGGRSRGMGRLNDALFNSLIGNTGGNGVVGGVTGNELPSVRCQYFVQTSDSPAASSTWQPRCVHVLPQTMFQSQLAMPPPPPCHSASIQLFACPMTGLGQNSDAEPNRQS